MDHVPGSHIGVNRLSNLEWSLPWPDQVDIAELVSTTDHTWDGLLLHAVLQRVGRLPRADRIEERLGCRNSSFSDIHLSKFTSVDVHMRFKFVQHGVTWRTPGLVQNLSLIHI